MLVVLLELGLAEWSVLLSALGCICLLMQFRFGPPLLLFSLVWMLLSQTRGFDPLGLLLSLFRGGFVLPVRPAPQLVPFGMALAVAFLVYSASYYRLMSLTQSLFPVDPRRKRWSQSLKDSRPGGEVPLLERRLSATVDSREIQLLVVSGVVWSVLGWLLWERLSAWRPQVNFNPVIWRALLLVWLAGMGLMLTSALLSYLKQALAGAEASAIYLQDQIWRETRREQSRLNRWLMAVRLRRQRKEGP
jgi:hypothetical protein